MPVAAAAVPALMKSRRVVMTVHPFIPSDRTIRAAPIML
jgi:hypothetical protein